MAKKAEILPELFWDSIPLTRKDSGVYGIINRADGRIYVGGTVNLSQRRGVHKHHIRHRLHAAKKLQAEIISSPENFEFVIIEHVADKAKILEREQFWLDFYQSYIPHNGYNRCRQAESIKGFKHGPEHGARTVAALKGKKRPPRTKEWCERLSASHIGRRPSLKHA